MTSPLHSGATGRFARLHLLLALLLTAAAASLLTACRDDDGPESVVPAVTEIATFEGNIPGQGATFTFHRVDDSPLVTIHAGVDIDTAKALPGDRAVVRYRPTTGADPYTSGRVNLVGIAPISTDTIRRQPIDNYPEWQRDGIYLHSMWRSGSYINLFCALPYDPSPRTFRLIVDIATVDQPVPQAYLVHILDDPAINTFSRDYYASWWIGPVWDRPSCKGIDIHLSNTCLPSLSKISFSKQ